MHKTPGFGPPAAATHCRRPGHHAAEFEGPDTHGLVLFVFVGVPMHRMKLPSVGDALFNGCGGARNLSHVFPDFILWDTFFTVSKFRHLRPSDVDGSPFYV